MRRSMIFSAVALAIILATPAFAGPPCRTDVGGLCGQDYDSWNNMYHRIGRPGLPPYGQQQYGRPGYGQQLMPQHGYGGQMQGGYHQGNVTWNTTTIIVPNYWRRVNGVCVQGQCP